jgi:FkbM family methyltransferase
VRTLQKVASRTAGAVGRDSWLVRRLRPGYEALLDALSGGKGIPWAVNEVEYRVDPHHRHQLAPAYDPAAAAFLRERVQPGDVCLNVGANVGVYVLQFAHWSRPDGRVIAFEPNPRAGEVLRRHVMFNHLEARVQIVPVAVGARPGQATLYAAGTDGMSRLGAPYPALAARARPIPVPMTTLDQYCDTTGLRPDWLLMDVEGAEIAVLAGARRLLQRHGAPLEIVVEMHPEAWTAAGASAAEAAAILAELQRDALPLSGQRDPLQEHGLVYLAPQGSRRRGRARAHAGHAE